MAYEISLCLNPAEILEGRERERAVTKLTRCSCFVYALVFAIVLVFVFVSRSLGLLVYEKSSSQLLTS